MENKKLDYKLTKSRTCYVKNDDDGMYVCALRECVCKVQLCVFSEGYLAIGVTSYVRMCVCAFVRNKFFKTHNRRLLDHVAWKTTST